jgi:TatD DNase family protein
MIDTHCHLDFQDFDQDREQVLKRCENVGVTELVIPAISAATFARTIAVCDQYSNLNLALGLHPVFIDSHQPQDLIKLDNLLNSLSQRPARSQPVAVGEIGLDFFEPCLLADDLKEKQIAFFTKQLIIAKRHSLPVIIHNRKAHDECLMLLNEHRVVGGVIHAFNGSIQQAEKYIALGFALGFGGMLTFDRSSKLKFLAERIPLSSIVLETDSPDMTVAQHKGQRNSPEYLPYVQSALADIKGCTPQTITETTTANAKRVLNL